MKKLITYLLLTCLLLSLCACAGGDTETTGTTETTAPPTEPTVGFSEGFPEELQKNVSPWTYDVVEKAKEDGKVHYYFMSSKGLFMSETENYPYKWGDSCLIVTPDGKTALIDAGMEAYLPVLVENLKRMGITRIDYLLMTHQHNDHCFGALCDGGILDSFEVGQVYWSGVYNYTWVGMRDKLETICQERNIPLQIVKKGDMLSFGVAQVEVLWPEVGMAGQTAETSDDVNNNSIVFRLDYKEHSALFTGDLYKAGEEAVVASAGSKLDVDFLKIPHHGHATSSKNDFVQAVTAKLGVATGFVEMENIVKNAYDAVGTKVLYDFYNGYIHVAADGDNLEYDTAQTRARDEKNKK